MAATLAGPQNRSMPIAFDIEILRRSEMFAGLDAEALQAVVSAGAVRRLPAGARVFAQGDPGVTGHSLVEGRIKIVQTRADGSQSVLRQRATQDHCAGSPRPGPVGRKQRRLIRRSRREG